MQPVHNWLVGHGFQRGVCNDAIGPINREAGGYRHVSLGIGNGQHVSPDTSAVNRHTSGNFVRVLNRLDVQHCAFIVGGVCSTLDQVQWVPIQNRVTRCWRENKKDFTPLAAGGLTGEIRGIGDGTAVLCRTFQQGIPHRFPGCLQVRIRGRGGRTHHKHRPAFLGKGQQGADPDICWPLTTIGDGGVANVVPLQLCQDSGSRHFHDVTVVTAAGGTLGSNAVNMESSHNGFDAAALFHRHHGDAVVLNQV